MLQTFVTHVASLVASSLRNAPPNTGIVPRFSGYENAPDFRELSCHERGVPNVGIRLAHANKPSTGSLGPNNQLVPTIQACMLLIH